MHNWKKIEGHIATPKGFRAAASSAGIKKKSGALDLVLIVSESEETSAAGVFTTNVAAAAPVLLCRRHLEASRGRARAVVVNAGNANACTGKAGAKAAALTAGETAKLLAVKPEQILVSSTGVIGVPLKAEKITRQLHSLFKNLSSKDASPIARAIMTTDTVPKCCVVRSQLGGKPVHIAGIAKGSGMIHPHLATMLSFITTDAEVGPRMFQHLLRAAVELSFNRVSVDGDTSTNDSVIALASGASGVAVRPGNQSRAWFLTGLLEVCQSLARMIAQDGEGAKKLVNVEVTGARKASDAQRIARAIANSPLVKTAVAGSDPNWGRIICAAGYSGATFDPTKVDILINDLYLCRHGLDAKFSEATAKRQLDREEVTLRINLHQGTASARMWTCDFTHDYITINASYRT